MEKVGLFYPPDPASLRQSVIGGNVAECAGGPRAFKYGTTKQYVLGLEAVLPDRRDRRDRRQGRQERRRLRPDAPARRVGRHARHHHQDHPAPGPEAARAGDAARRRSGRSTPPSRRRRDHSGARRAGGHRADRRHVARSRRPQPARCGRSRRKARRRILLVEVDGVPASVADEAIARRARAPRGGATEVLHARDEAERQELWRVRRELSLSLKMVAGLKFNHDVVVPKARIPALFALVQRIAAEHRLRIPCFGHAGDGNIHVNIMVDPADADEIQRAHDAERRAVRRASSRWKARSAASTASASRRRRSSRSSCRPTRSPDETREGGLRSPRSSESGKDLSMTMLLLVMLGLALVDRLRPRSAGRAADRSASSSRPRQGRSKPRSTSCARRSPPRTS